MWFLTWGGLLFSYVSHIEEIVMTEELENITQGHSSDTRIWRDGGVIYDLHQYVRSLYTMLENVNIILYYCGIFFSTC